MPYTNTPSNDTYSSKELPLMHDLTVLPSAGYQAGGGDYVDGLKTRLLSGATNVLPYKSEDGNTIYGETRGALQATTVTSGNNTITRGYHIWHRSLGVDISTAVGDEMYEILVTNDTNSSKLWWRVGAIGAWTSVALNFQRSTVVRFCEFIDATNAKKLVMSDGFDLYVITAAASVLTVTRCTDVDMPTPHVPFPVFLDGYIFLAKEGTGDIYNCDLNNPLSWTAGNFISAEMYPDDIQALVRVNNYILALGTGSGEYFYDAGNASGSPLQRQENAALPFGTEFPNSIAYTKDTVMLLASDSRGDYTFQVIRGFKHEPFPGGEAVIEVLQSQIFSGGATYKDVRAGFLKQHNKLFYFFAFNGSQADTAWTTDTVMASLDCQMWVRTVSDLYNSGTPAGQFGFPVLFAHSTAATHRGLTFVAGHFSSTGGAFTGTLNSARFYDQLDAFNTYNIYQKITIPPERFGTWNRKFMSRAAVDYVVQPSLDVGSQALGLQLRYSDDLTASWTTAFPSGSVTGNFPFFTQLGNFRQRMFEVVALSQRMRYHKLEVDINKGQQ
jgi:hypothetical protein